VKQQQRNIYRKRKRISSNKRKRQRFAWRRWRFGIRRRACSARRAMACLRNSSHARHQRVQRKKTQRKARMTRGRCRFRRAAPASQRSSAVVLQPASAYSVAAATLPAPLFLARSNIAPPAHIAAGGCAALMFRGGVLSPVARCANNENRLSRRAAWCLSPRLDVFVA